ncbi:hypothetical protein CVT25_009057 [Psilocybe cyanescens]|uniref:Uncharacterized protein n=1 Tax=Psilocybe cyanescens TaxID=93625 RepID=A0A409X2V4_PSICY|nr:hypothetical protein CVT25_009057 [Psilocybe cyanescens]
MLLCKVLQTVPAAVSTAYDTMIPAFEVRLERALGDNGDNIVLPKNKSRPRTCRERSRNQLRLFMEYVRDGDDDCDGFSVRTAP